MSELILDDAYWSSRYQLGNTGWDIGAASTPLMTYFDQIPDKNLRILIPGCGNAWEANHLLQKGFQHITLLDISSTLVEDLKATFFDQPISILHQNFFEHEGEYDLIVEQTFFCALPPALRPDYVLKMKELLTPKGKLAGLLFDIEFNGGPPFGGNQNEYLNLFQPHFSIHTLKPCHNSISKRQNQELFFIFQRY